MKLYHTENLNDHVFFFQFVFLTCKMLCNITSWGASDYSNVTRHFIEKEKLFLYMPTQLISHKMSLVKPPYSIQFICNLPDNTRYIYALQMARSYISLAKLATLLSI